MGGDLLSSPNNFTFMKKILFLVLMLSTQIYTVAQNFEINWQQCFGGSETDKVFDIISSQGGYLINGWTASDDGDISLNHGLSDGWLIKIDSNGNIMWEKTYGGVQGDNFVRIFSNFNNEYYLLGASNSSEGDISFDPYPGTWDFWIVKIDSSGNIIWDKIVGGNGDEVLWTGTLTDDGGILAFGWTGSEDGDISVYYGLYDMWMVKLNSEGEKEWDFTIGTSGFDIGQAIIQTSDGGYLAGGSSMIGEGGNLSCIPHSWKADAILVKLDSLRNIEWNRCYGGSDYDGVYGIIETENGYVFSAYTDSNDGDVSGWHGGTDIWVVKIDLLGDILWQNCFGGSNGEIAYNIFEVDDEGFVIYGITGSFDGDITGNHSLSEYEHDIWIIKLNSEGDLLWQQCIGGIGDERLDFGIIKKSDNNYVIAGQTDYGPSFDVECTPHAGVMNYPDFWVFEIQDTTTNIINNITKEKVINVYPNPAQDYVNFEYNLPADKKEVILSVINILGIETARFKISYKKGIKVWNTKNIKQGIYFYNLNTSGFSISGKIIITK